MGDVPCCTDGREADEEEIAMDMKRAARAAAAAWWRTRTRRPAWITSPRRLALQVRASPRPRPPGPPCSFRHNALGPLIARPARVQRNEGRIGRAASSDWPRPAGARIVRPCITSRRCQPHRLLQIVRDIRAARHTLARIAPALIDRDPRLGTTRCSEPRRTPSFEFQ